MNDYEVIVAGVRAMLTPYRARVEVVEIDVERNPAHNVDVALFDTYGRPHLGLEAIRSLSGSARIGALAVYTWTITPAARHAAQRAGAGGIIAKSLPAVDLIEALEEVARGHFVVTRGFRSGGDGRWPGLQWGLTGRESEVLALLSTGLTNRAIADALLVSENTIRTHLKAVFRKLGVSNRGQAVAQAVTDPSFATGPNRAV